MEVRIVIASECIGTWLEKCYLGIGRVWWGDENNMFMIWMLVSCVYTHGNVQSCMIKISLFLCKFQLWLSNRSIKHNSWKQLFISEFCGSGTLTGHCKINSSFQFRRTCNHSWGHSNDCRWTMNYFSFLLLMSALGSLLILWLQGDHTSYPTAFML